MLSTMYYHFRSFRKMFLPTGKHTKHPVQDNKHTSLTERKNKMRKINFASFKELPKHVFVCWIISTILCALAIIFLSLDVFAGMWNMHNPGMLMLIVAQSMNFFFICKYRDRIYPR